MKCTRTTLAQQTRMMAVTMTMTAAVQTLMIWLCIDQSGFDSFTNNRCDEHHKMFVVTTLVGSASEQAVADSRIMCERQGLCRSIMVFSCPRLRHTWNDQRFRKWSHPQIESPRQRESNWTSILRLKAAPRLHHRDTAFFMLNSKNLFITYIIRVYDESIDDSDFLIMPCWTRTKSWNYSQSRPSLDYFHKRAVFVKMTKRKTSYSHLFNNLLQKASSDAASPESHLAYECTPNVGSSEVRGGTSNKQ